MLYSYLLTRSEFKIDAAPEGASRDRQFAYAVYVDLLLLLIELSGIRLSRPQGSQPQIVVDNKLAGNRVGRALFENDSVKNLILRGNNDIEAFDPYLQQIVDQIQASKVYTDYKRRRKLELADDVALWTTILQTIIARSPEVEQALRTNPDFTNLGFERGLKQVVDTLSAFSDSRETYTTVRNDLQRSLDKAYQLYVDMLSLIVALTDLQAQRIETQKNKYLATADDRNPNMHFVENKFVEALRQNPSYQELIKRFRPQWTDDPILLQILLDKVIASDEYAHYMTQREATTADDAEFWREVMRTVILPSDDLVEALEDKSVFWNDDLFIMGTFVIKTIRQFATGDPATVTLLPQYKDEEDAEFGRQLFDIAVDNRETYRALIDNFINPAAWDSERLAFMDIVVMITAIGEIINFPLVPVTVSLNEYIEIANNYSTEKSGQFVNGVLCSVIKKLNADGTIHKPFDSIRQ